MVTTDRGKEEQVRLAVKNKRSREQTFVSGDGRR